MSFNALNLHEKINKSLIACGFTEPTPIQAKSIPIILSGKDIVASAQTGTGKTAAFVLPALHMLSEQKPSHFTKVLILTPTRELAKQITDAAIQFSKFSRTNIVNLVGGMPYHQQIRALKQGADIIVATPGRLLDHIDQQRVNLSQLQMLVLDEADRMLDMGFIDDVEAIAKLTPSGRQTLLFSATVDKQLAKVVQHLLNHPVRVDLSEQRLTVPKIEQSLYKARNSQHKAALLRQIINEENIFKAIIFSATKNYADRLADQLCEDGYSAAALHGDLRQNVRNRTIDQLRRGKIQYLVATDVAARGIDISDITHVINYDLPRSSEDYVHRIGRTGRAGKSGKAISFALPSELQQVQRIEKYIGQRLPWVRTEDSHQESKHSEQRANRKHSNTVINEWLDDEANSAPAKRKQAHDSEGRRDRKTSDNSFSSRRSRKNDDERRPFSSKRGKDDDRTFSSKRRKNDDKPFASRRRADDDKPFASRRRADDDKPFASRRRTDDDHSFSSRRRKDDDKPFRSRRDKNENKPFSARRDNDENKSFSAKRKSKNGKPYSTSHTGKAKRFQNDDKPFSGKRKSFGKSASTSNKRRERYDD